MQHIFFFDGNSKKIAWTIKTENSTVTQKRIHADIYLNKVNELQSKYIALHVGLFWGIGKFIIRNEDTVSIKTDEKKIFDHFTNDLEISDEFIDKRKNFIDLLISQRKLKTDYELLDFDKNPTSKII